MAVCLSLRHSTSVAGEVCSRSLLTTNCNLHESTCDSVQATKIVSFYALQRHLEV